jgi:hypothetical protein
MKPGARQRVAMDRAGVVFAVTVLFLGDAAHALWHHVALGLTLGDLLVELGMGAGLSVVVCAFLMLRGTERSASLVAVLAGLYSLARGVSGATSGEAVWAHVVLSLTGVPLMAIGTRCWLTPRVGGLRERRL